jgi:hypothetical protein
LTGAVARIAGPIVRDTFRQAVAAPRRARSTLTGNGMVFTTRLAGGRVILPADDLHIRVVDAVTGELLCELIIDPPATISPRTRETPEPVGSRVSDVLRHHICRDDRV